MVFITVRPIRAHIFSRLCACFCKERFDIERELTVSYTITPSTITLFTLLDPKPEGQMGPQVIPTNGVGGVITNGQVSLIPGFQRGRIVCRSCVPVSSLPFHRKRVEAVPPIAPPASRCLKRQTSFLNISGATIPSVPEYHVVVVTQAVVVAGMVVHIGTGVCGPEAIFLFSETISAEERYQAVERSGFHQSRSNSPEPDQQVLAVFVMAERERRNFVFRRMDIRPRPVFLIASLLAFFRPSSAHGERCVIAPMCASTRWRDLPLCVRCR